MYQAARQGQFGGGAMGQTMMGGTMMDGTMMGATRPQQAIFQPGFAGTNANQVRQDIFGGMTGDGFTQQAVGMQGGMMAGGMQDGLYPIRRGMQGTPQQAGNVQSVLQPGFGTNPQQVRQDIARDLAYGTQQQQGGMMAGGMQGGMMASGMQGGMMAGGMMDGTSMMAGGMQDGLYPIRRGMQGTPQQAGNVQSVLQPGFGTNPQQVRQDIARDLAYGTQQQQGGMMAGGMQGGMMASGMQGGMMAGGMMDGTSMMAGGMQDGLYPIRRGMQGTPQMAQNAQSVLQPGFGTNPQQVRQDISRDLAYGSQQQQGGMAGGMQGGLMAGGMMDGASMMTGGMQGGMMAGGLMDGSAPIRRGMQGTQQMAQNAQSIFQPGFGTNPQQVRQDIARDLAYGGQQQQGGMMTGGMMDGSTMMAGGMMDGASMMAGGMQGGMMAGGMMDGSMMAGGMMDGSAPIRRGMQASQQMARNPQSVLQPNFGTNPMQVRQDIARDLAYGNQQQQGAGQQMTSLQAGMLGAGQGSLS